MKKMKRAKPEPSLTGVPMPSYESFRQVTMLIVKDDIPAFDLLLLSHALLMAIEKCDRAMPDVAYAEILRVAACLRKQHCDEVLSEGLAREAIRKAMTTLDQHQKGAQ
jgi:hypothetical protein